MDLAFSMTTRSNRCAFEGNWVSSARRGNVVPVCISEDAPQSLDIPTIEYDHTDKAVLHTVAYTLSNILFNPDGTAESVSPQMVGVFCRVLGALEMKGCDIDNVYQFFFIKRSVALLGKQPIDRTNIKTRRSAPGCQSLYHAPGVTTEHYDSRCSRKVCTPCYEQERLVVMATWIKVRVFIF